MIMAAGGCGCLLATIHYPDYYSATAKAYSLPSIEPA